MASDLQTVLELFGASPPAVVHPADESTRELSPSPTNNGLCHSPTRRAESSVAGVKFSDSILPGEVIS